MSILAYRRIDFQPKNWPPFHLGEAESVVQFPHTYCQRLPTPSEDGSAWDARWTSTAQRPERPFPLPSRRRAMDPKETAYPTEQGVSMPCLSPGENR